MASMTSEWFLPFDPDHCYRMKKLPPSPALDDRTNISTR
jgi:hypothetical protein